MKQKMLCVCANHRLSPKEEDNVTEYHFKALHAPLGKHSDSFLETYVTWSNVPEHYQVGKKYDLTAMVSVVPA